MPKSSTLFSMPPAPPVDSDSRGVSGGREVAVVSVELSLMVLLLSPSAKESVPVDSAMESDWDPGILASATEVPVSTSGTFSLHCQRVRRQLPSR